MGAAIHYAAIVWVGGDWMPLARLVAPVIPSLVLVSAHLLARASSAWALGRLALACSWEVALLALRGPAASRVQGDRATLMASGGAGARAL